MNLQQMAQTLRDAGYTVIAPHDKASIRKETAELVAAYTGSIRTTRRSYPKALLKSCDQVLRDLGMIK